MNNNPNWYKLIYHWCRRRTPKGYGLTLPFLIGATKISTLKELLTEVSETLTLELIILRFCYDREEYVLSLDDSTYPLAKNLSGQKHLLYDDDKIESMTGFNEVINYLTEKYSMVINEKHFSKNMKTNEWEKFSQEDIEFIQKALSE